MSERQTKAGNQITLSHSLILSLSHSLLTLNMLNNFCFHVYAQKSLSSPWKVGIGAGACNTGCYRRRSPVTPGVTGAVRRCAPAPFACNTRCYRRTAPVAPGITGGPIRGHEICCNQSEFPVRLAPIACNTRCYRRTAPVTPGVTGERRQ